MALPISIQIKDKIIEKIESLPSIQKVYPSATVTDEGWPAVSVTPDAEEGEFSSNAENSRVYSYNCTIIFPLSQDYVPEAERERADYAERVIAQCTEEIINVIDTDYELDRDASVLYVNAADAEWAYYDLELGMARACNIVLRVYTEVTVI
jgi:hypothetical protein